MSSAGNMTDVPKACVVCGAWSGEARCPAHRAGRGANGWEWTRLRSQALARDLGMCKKCGARASDVDHVIALKAGGTNDLWNLQSLCGDCHDEKSYGAPAPASRRRWRGRGRS